MLIVLLINYVQKAQVLYYCICQNLGEVMLAPLVSSYISTEGGLPLTKDNPSNNIHEKISSF